MKKIVLFTLLVFFFNNHYVHAQKNSEVAAVAAAGAILGGVAIKLAVEQYKEQMELFATEYILENQPEIKKFELSIIDFEGVKATDLSNVSCINFGLKIINADNLNENRVLMMFLSRGWLNEFGIDVTRVKWKLLAAEEWDDIFFNYIELASPIKLADKHNLPVFKIANSNSKNYSSNEIFTFGQGSDGYTDAYLKSPETFKIGSGKLVGSNIQYLNTDKSAAGNYKFAFPLSKYDENIYFLKDFSNEFKVIYNEKTMGLYIKSLGKLVQLQRSTINLIQTFLH